MYPLQGRAGGNARFTSPVIVGKNRGLVGLTILLCEAFQGGGWDLNSKVVTPMPFWLKLQCIEALLFFSRPPDPRSSTPEECLHLRCTGFIWDW